MAKNSRFEMQIVDLFQFRDGRAVFVGRISSSAPVIGACTCRLLVDGVERATIHVEGEMIPNGTHPEGHRSVSTTEPVPLDRQTVLSSKCSLESMPE